MKRIVYTIRSLGNSGGVERVCINKANWLVSKGYDVTIITEEAADCFYQVDSRIKMLSLNITKRLSDNLIIRLWRFILFSIEYWLKISRFLREIKPDAVISINARDFYILPFVNKRSKKIYEFHWIVSQPGKEKGKGSLVEWVGKRFADIVGNHYDSIVLLTQKDKVHIDNEWKNVTVIPNALTFSCDTPATLSENNAIAVGNLFHVKGFSRLIDVWDIVHERYPDWTLSIYGDGYLREELQSKINDLSLVNVVKLEGKVVDIKTAYLKSSLSLISSYEESFSLTLLEAQASGLPVIAFDCPWGPSEIITQDVNGFLIPDGDIKAFADKICFLIENEKLRREMGYNALLNSESYAEDKVMAQWVQLLDQ